MRTACAAGWQLPRLGDSFMQAARAPGGATDKPPAQRGDFQAQVPFCMNSAASTCRGTGLQAID